MLQHQKPNKSEYLAIIVSAPFNTSNDIGGLVEFGYNINLIQFYNVNFFIIRKI